MNYTFLLIATGLSLLAIGAPFFRFGRAVAPKRILWPIYLFSLAGIVLAISYVEGTPTPLFITSGAAVLGIVVYGLIGFKFCDECGVIAFSDSFAVLDNTSCYRCGAKKVQQRKPAKIQKAQFQRLQ